MDRLALTASLIVTAPHLQLCGFALLEYSTRKDGRRFPQQLLINVSDLLISKHLRQSF